MPSSAAPAADPAEGLALIKPAVKAQPAYTLDTPAPRIKINQNESPYDVPADLKRAIVERALAMPWHRYPEFTPTALLERLATHFGWTGSGMMAGNGSNELIQATLTVALDGGDVVVAPAPTFSLYRLMTNVLGGRYVPVPLGPEFTFDADALVQTAVEERAKVVVLTSPNNPTGTLAPAEIVPRLLEATDALILCDEAYQEFGGPSWIPLLRESSRVVVVRTFSKAMGLAGMRFGVGLAHPEMAAQIGKAKLPYNVNQVTLAAAETVLDNYGRCQAIVDELIATRNRFVLGLNGVSGLTPYPTAANFVLVRVRAMPARQLYQRLLTEHGILVRDVSGSVDLHECLRISIGSPAEMDETLAALKAILG
jgi:histidinol-phosphate aminotransferase